MRIFIDGDACPVIKNTIKIAKQYSIPVVIVKNHFHVIKDNYAEIISVDFSKDSADYYIVNHLKKNDIVVSQDYGLAAMVIARNAYFITAYGKEINDNNLASCLNSRYITQMLKSQNKRPKAKKAKRKSSDNIIFEKMLINLIVKVKNKS
ncbi:DUF188 domain-containing protein [Clostridium sp. 'deep sea']|uniref:DUF188 domain-containing protein n=1 Tax=Clostridium sp. 'deep sea' TaxID=2779445 RepID=UPI00189698FB|nr:DUF188 domain-containing protein [Clostridium sp. 'deep sea']QOR35390.1 DUF188 domain-containing protein [Clostridium sp. 'deep sea']